jgi:hypothetical protein
VRVAVGTGHRADFGRFRRAHNTRRNASASRRSTAVLMARNHV